MNLNYLRKVNFAVFLSSYFAIPLVFVFCAGVLFSAQSDKQFLLIDDFNAMNSANKLEGGVHPWEKDPGDASQWCRVSYDTFSFVGPSGHSLKIDYNIDSNMTTYMAEDNKISAQEVGTHGVAFNGIYSLLNELDATPYNYLIFSARGDEHVGFTRKFKVEIQDNSRRGEYFVDGLTSKWQKIVIPLDQFSSVIDLSKLKAFVIVFDQNVTRKEGIIYIDDLYLAKNKFDDIYPLSYDVHKAVHPIIIDGLLRDWNDVPPISIDGEKNLELGAVSGKSDLSAEGYYQWDEQYLYFAVNVKDSEVLPLRSPRDFFQSDSVELFIDPENNGLVFGNPKDFQIDFSPPIPGKKPQIFEWFQNREPTRDEVRFASVKTRGGYCIEAAISWEFISPTLASAVKQGATRTLEGTMLQSTFAVNDVDIEDKTPHAKINWFFKKDSADPTKFNMATLRLVNR